MLRFQCTCCGNGHESPQSYACAAPLYYESLPATERETRGTLGSDTCVVDGEAFFARGCIEVPVHGEGEPFVGASGCR